MERKLDGQTKVQERTGQPVLVHVNEGNSYEVDRRTHMNTNQRVTENRLKEVELRPSVTQQMRNINVNVVSEKPIVNQKYVDKIIEVVEFCIE